jgi:hypothetical protein
MSENVWGGGSCQIMIGQLYILVVSVLHLLLLYDDLFKTFYSHDSRWPIAHQSLIYVLPHFSRLLSPLSSRHWQVYFLFSDPFVAVLMTVMKMARSSSHKILSMFSCLYPCFLVDTLVFLAHSPVFLCVGGGGEDVHIPISSTSTKSPIISNKVHVLSSVLFPCLLHFEVELHSCPHTQPHTR